MFGIIVGADNIAKISPFLECFSAAQGSAAAIFSIIDRQSKIDSLSTEGKTVSYGIKGDIQFENVFFHYPSRPDVPVSEAHSIYGLHPNNNSVTDSKWIKYEFF